MVPGLTPVPYMDETGANATATEYTQIEPTTANWTGGRYVVKGNVTTPGNVTVSGAMPGIILCDGASLTAQGGIALPDGSPVPLSIYGQTGGTGTMTVTNKSGAAAMTDETYGTAPGTPSLAGRTGDSSAPVTWYYSAGDRPAAEWKNIGPDTLDAGTYSLYAVIGETENYSAFTTPAVTFRVNKALPAYTAPAGLTAQYDQTLAVIALPGGWSWMEGSTPVGDPAAAAKTFLARFTPEDTVNYETVENIPVAVLVRPAPGGSLGAVRRAQKYTDLADHTLAPDWSGLPAGESWTFSSEASAALARQDFAADGSLLTYAISGGKAGDAVTITLTVDLTDREVQAALAVTGETTVVYGQTLTLSTTGGSGTGQVTWQIDRAHSTGDAVIDENGILTPVKAGSVAIIAVKAGDAQYHEAVSEPFAVTVEKAASSGEPRFTPITSSGRTLKGAGLTQKDSTPFPADGALEWVDDGGVPLPETTVVEANRTYRWRFTPADDNDTPLTGEIERYHWTAPDVGITPPVYPVNTPEQGENGSISSD